MLVVYGAYASLLLLLLMWVCLLVRLNPDSDGRFGFHVKGGVDLNLPVFVSKVKGDSPVRSTITVIKLIFLSPIPLSFPSSSRPVNVSHL